MASASAAALAGTVTYHLAGPALNRFFDLAATGTAAAAAALVILFALDRQARTVAHRLLTRARR